MLPRSDPEKSPGTAHLNCYPKARLLNPPASTLWVFLSTSETAETLTLAESNWKYKVVSTEETSAASSTSGLTSRLSFLPQETVTRRGLADPIFSPILDVLGRWNLFVPSSSSPWPRVTVPLVLRPFACHLTILAPPSLVLFCCCQVHS